MRVIGTEAEDSINIKKGQREKGRRKSKGEEQSKEKARSTLRTQEGEMDEEQDG